MAQTEQTHTAPAVVEQFRCAIRTKYIGPTNTRGSRVAVWRADGKYADDPDAIRVPWSNALNMDANHSAAIAEYLTRKAENGNNWHDGMTWHVACLESGQRVAIGTPNGGE